MYLQILETPPTLCQNPKKLEKLQGQQKFAKGWGPLFCEKTLKILAQMDHFYMVLSTHSSSKVGLYAPITDTCMWQ